MAFLPLLSGVLVAALFVSVRSYRQGSLGRAFLLYVLTTSIWSWGYVMELCATRANVAVFWANVQYFGIPTTPVAIFLFAVILSGGSVWDRKWWVLLALPCVAVWIAAWTDGTTHLLRENLTFLQYGTYRVLQFRPGPAYMANIAFSYTLVVATVVLLVRMLHRGDTLSRKHAQIFLAGLCLPILGNISRVFGFEPIRGIDQTPLMFALAAVVVGYGVFRWSLVSVAPIARDKVVDGLADAVIVVDPRDRVVDANPAAFRLFGLTTDEMSRAYLKDLESSLPDGALPEAGQGTMFVVNGAAYIGRRTLITGTGLTSIGTLLQFTDVTEQRRTEEVLRRAKEAAEEASAAKSRFVAHVSHELRTPLNGVIGLSTMLEATWLDNVQRGYLSGIRQCSETLLGLVNDVLDLSKLDADAMPIAKDSVEIEALIRSVTEVHRYAAERKGVELHTDIHDMPEYVETDSLRLRQILNNLLGNAVKFTAEGRIDIIAASQGSTFDIVVRDTGIGIPEDQREAVLEPFQQADNSSTRKYGGTGLGLSITVSLVHRMGGALKLESRENVGTTVTVALPLVAVAAPVEAEAEEEVPPGLRVLVAEDNEVNALVVTNLLEGLGCEVEHCENGLLALEAYEHGNFDLLLLDIQMPVMDGLQLTRAIRERWPNRHTLIFALTANALEEERQEAVAAGMDGFLTKPIRLTELSNALHVAARTVAP